MGMTGETKEKALLVAFMIGGGTMVGLIIGCVMGKDGPLVTAGMGALLGAVFGPYLAFKDPDLAHRLYVDFKERMRNMPRP